MSGFFKLCMTRAPIILFAMAVIVAVLGFVTALIPFFGAVGQMASNLYAESQGFSLTSVFGAVFAALSAAVWPFFGAAILWRMDRSSSMRDVRLAA